MAGKVTVMGLGVHGGGAASAAFFANRGAEVTVTDLRTADQLAPSLDLLKGLPVRYVLGEHREADFRNADLVIKNPGVPASSPYLAMADRIETDISVFLTLTENPVVAVTGSKGKSFTASAIHRILEHSGNSAKLGGNITVSPLTFIDELEPGAPVVLELSSWQLGDLRGKGVLRPEAAVVTTIIPDHQDYYGSMEPYIADKKVIFESQNKDQYTILNGANPDTRQMADETPGCPLIFSPVPLEQDEYGAYLTSPEGPGYIRLKDRKELILPESISVPGAHQRLNLLAAGLAGSVMGADPDRVRDVLSRFTGIPHRLEPAGEAGGISFYNDSAATVPQAVGAALSGFSRPVHLVTGGTDKSLDFSVVRDYVRKPAGIYLLEGTGTRKIIPILRELGIPFRGPYADLERCVADAFSSAVSGDVILFSPGCTSFGMFRNEFHRGECFKKAVKELSGKR